MNKTSNVDDINWDETRVIFISPGYTKYQKRASGFHRLPIELYEIKKYQSNMITLNRIDNSQIQSSDLTKSTKSKTHVSTSTPKLNKLVGRHGHKTHSRPDSYSKITLLEYTEEDYLAGKYDGTHPTEETKALWNQLRGKIEDEFEDIEFRQKKVYAGYYLKDGGSSVCTLEASRTKILLSFATTDMTLLETSEFVKDISNVGHRGLGNFCSAIKNSNDIERAIPLIQKVYSSKKQA